VHHKVPRREFDTADEAHNLENLVTLCCRCHGRAEAEDVETACEQFFQENDERLGEAIDELGDLPEPKATPEKEILEDLQRRVEKLEGEQ
jgi:5-methylcytosine-specific restriction endonuclease McrA